MNLVNNLGAFARRFLNLQLVTICLTMLTAPRFAMADSMDDIADEIDSKLESQQQSGLLIIGGGGALPEDVYKYFISVAGGVDARIVLIPSAYPFKSHDEIEETYGELRDYGITSLDYLDTDDRELADDDEFVAPLWDATAVWIGGGDQGRLADRYVGTKVEQLIRRVWERGGVVGGTSAGASILSEIMIREGTSSVATTDRGLGIVPNWIIDQHFRQRERAPRLHGVLAENPDQWGLGIDEGTAVIYDGRRIRVVGHGSAWFGFVDEDGNPVTVAELSEGDEFELEQ